MNKRQENKLTMYESVLSTFRAHTEILGGVPFLKSGMEKFEKTIELIHKKLQEFHSATAGKSSMKSQAEDEFIATLLPVASALFIYAKEIRDTELREKVRMSENKLYKTRDTELAEKGMQIVELAETHGVELGKRGITAEMISVLKTNANNFHGAIGIRESSVAERIGARTTVETLFDQADEILEDEVDRAMELVRQADSQFYNEYFASRLIRSAGIRHLTEEERQSRNGHAKAPIEAAPAVS